MAKAWVSHNEKTIDFDGTVIGISATGPTEQSKGKSTLRFRLENEYFAHDEPFNSLSEFLAQETEVTLLVENERPIEHAKVRECRLNPSTKRLYLQFYLPFSAQETRRRFIKS